jgi:hypothetical protein
MKKNRTNVFSLALYFKESYITAILFPLITAELLLCTLLYNSLKNEKLDVSLAIIISTVSIIMAGTVILLYIFHILGKIVKLEKEKEFIKCSQCSTDYKKYIFLRHGLLTLDDLIAREKKFAYHPQPSKCKVYNYTTLRDTFVDSDETVKFEDKIENIITENIAAGVEYYVFYVEEDFLNADNKNQRLYGNKNLIDCTNEPKIFKYSEFDYLLQITPEGATGYVAVCFLSETERCGNCAYSTQCDYKNNEVLYRILSIEETNYIFKKLEALKRQKEVRRHEQAV